MAVKKSAIAPAAKTAETSKARVVRNATSMATGGEIVVLLIVMVLLAGSAIAVALLG
jgi:hypothetical protein